MLSILEQNTDSAGSEILPVEERLDGSPRPRRGSPRSALVPPLRHTAGVNRLSLVLVPLVVAVGLLAYEASRGRLDGELLAGLGLFLVIAAVIGTVVHRLGRDRGEASPPST
jgi:hypothetical protein